MQTQLQPVIRNYSDKEYVQQHLAELTAFIWISPVEVSILLYHPAQQRVAGLFKIFGAKNSLFDTALSDWKQLLNELPFKIGDVEQAHVYLVHSGYTLMPDALFVPEKAAVVYDLVHKRERFSSVHHVHSALGVVLYSVKDILLSTLKVLFPGASVSHYAATLYPAYQKIKSTDSAPTLYLHLHARYIDVCRFEKQRLVYHNTFPFEADTDIIYFLLSVAEEQQLNMHQLHVVLSGNCQAGSPLLLLMKKYVPQVSLMSRPDQYAYPASFREMQEHQYFAELTAALCE